MIDYKFIPKDNLKDALMELFHIAKMLRSPDGCPWDRKQTLKSTALDLMDETYEYIDAVDDKNKEEQQEEIGDVMFNALMLLEMHDEKPDFPIVDSINGICEKLVRRHPHVFGDKIAKNCDEVLVQWNDIKVNVEGRVPDENDFFSHVPTSLPPLERCKEISRKAVKVGFDWNDKQGIIDKVCEELDEVIEADTALDRHQEEVELEVGDLLFSVVNYARFLVVDPTVALHKSNRKFERRFNEVAKMANKDNIPLDSAHVVEMNRLWDKVKETETNNPKHKDPTTY